MFITEKIKPFLETSESSLVLKQAVNVREIEAAMRLRFEVFNLELNEGLQSSYRTGLDEDEYDSYCDHIIVVDTAKDKVVGTYRLLPGSRAENGTGYYSENEFEMSSFKKLPGNKLELGRACVHRDYRGFSILNLMWAGIGRYIEINGINFLFGCGSLHTINPNIVSNVYSYFKSNYLAEEKYRVYPIKKIPGFDPDSGYDRSIISRHLPPLILSYLKIGARIAGEPALDEQFGVSDFLIILDREKIIDRYKKHYLSGAL